MENDNLEEKNDEFEYNDGLGDLLREKEKKKFSWAKTTIVLSVLIFLIFVSLTLVFNFSKSVFTGETQKSPQQYEHQVDKNTDAEENSFERQIAQIEKENQSLMDELENDLEKVEMKTSVRKNMLQKKTSKAPTKKVISKSKRKITFKVIAGTFRQIGNAKLLETKLNKSKITSFISQYRKGNSILYRVQVGAFYQYKPALQFKNKLSAQGIDSYIVKHHN